jgi:hypothetical protein
MRFPIPALSTVLLILLLAGPLLLPAVVLAEVKGPGEQADLKLKVIAIAPFRVSAEAEDGRWSARDPISGTIFRTCPIPAGSERVVEDLFVKKTAAYPTRMSPGRFPKSSGRLFPPNPSTCGECLPCRKSAVK